MPIAGQRSPAGYLCLVKGVAMQLEKIVPGKFYRRRTGGGPTRRYYTVIVEAVVDSKVRVLYLHNAVTELVDPDQIVKECDKADKHVFKYLEAPQFAEHRTQYLPAMTEDEVSDALDELVGKGLVDQHEE